jgi:hypothetical protein
VLLFVAVLFMGMLLGRSGTGDTADSALEQREAREDAAGDAREQPDPEPDPEPKP